MILAWYEQLVDMKGYLLFNKMEYTVTATGDHTPHFHKGIEITVCLSGESEVFINGETYPFNAGTVCFVNSLDIHKYRYTSGTERYVVVISPDMLNSIGWDVGISFPHITTDPSIFRQIKALLDLAHSNWSDDDEMLRRGFAEMLLALLKRLLPIQPENGKGGYYDTLTEILKYISSNSHKPLTAEATAAHFGYSPNYFSSFFKKLTGVTFKEYLNLCRVVSYQRLRERDNKISVPEAAEKCGFGSVKSLYRACKRSKEMRTYYAGYVLEN